MSPVHVSRIHMGELSMDNSHVKGLSKGTCAHSGIVYGSLHHQSAVGPHTMCCVPVAHAVAQPAFASASAVRRLQCVVGSLVGKAGSCQIHHLTNPVLAQRQDDCTPLKQMHKQEPHFLPHPLLAELTELTLRLLRACMATWPAAVTPTEAQ
jgi:hypothetical protein